MMTRYRTNLYKIDKDGLWTKSNKMDGITATLTTSKVSEHECEAELAGILTRR